MAYDNPLIGGVVRVLKILVIAAIVLTGLVLTSFVGIGLLLAWLVFRLFRHWRKPARPVHGPQVIEGEFEVVDRPRRASPGADLEWPRPFDSTRPS